MEIRQLQVTVGEIADGFHDDGDGGVTGYGGALDIRPPYQREFVYKEDSRDAVVDSVYNGYPIGAMYWQERDDGTYEVLDGQQRTISLCRFTKAGGFSLKLGGAKHTFGSLEDDVQERIRNYPLAVYVCTGAEADLMDWFERINTSGKPLTRQEIRNAVYHGKFVSAAKRRFSTPDASARFGRWMSRKPANRQMLLERGIKWGKPKDESIEDYMSRVRRNSAEATKLYKHAQQVVRWAEKTFGDYHRSMAGADWGRLHREHSSATHDVETLKRRAKEMQASKEIRESSGIYEYLLTGDRKFLEPRLFSDREREVMYAQQNGICAECGGGFDLEEMHADHVIAWSNEGPTDFSNGQMLCATCNGGKGNK